MISSYRSAWMLGLFTGLSLLNLYGEYLGVKALIFATKPLLLTLLALFFLANTLPSSFRNAILLGFIFSIGGDTLLMFTENALKGELYFILGLGSFLLAHVFYFAAFQYYPNRLSGPLYQKPALLFFFFLFLIANLLFLWPYLPTSLLIPVCLYSLVIVTMAAAAYNLQNRITSENFFLLFTGVLLFILSDSLIALNKFTPYGFKMARIAIMTTYICGQLMICLASIQLAAQLED